MRTRQLTAAMLVAGLMSVMASDGWAFYSPQTGRWLSRDPIGERGGPNPYEFVKADAVGRVDIDGRIIFVLQTFTSGECGGGHASWDFALSDFAPCDGHFVQMTTVSFMKRDCREKYYTLTYTTFWEMWPVKVQKGDRISADTSVPLTDSFQTRNSPDSDGMMLDYGVMRFICEGDFGNNDPRLWPTGSVAPGISTGILPHSLREPTWWDKGVEEVYHYLFANWGCCCGNRESKVIPFPGIPE